MRKRDLPALMIAVSAAACGAGSKAAGPSDPGVACTLEARPGIMLTALDSMSGQALAATGTAVVQDGSYSEKANAVPVTS